MTTNSLRFVHLAYKKKLIDENPFVGYKMPGQDVAAVYFTSQEVKDLFELYDSKELLYKKAGNILVDNYQKTLQILLFIIQTSLRIGEVFDLKVSNVIKIKGRLYIEVENRKGHEISSIPLSKRAYSLIKDILKVKLHGYVFANHK